MLTERLLIQLRPSSVLSVRLCQTMVCPFLTTGAFVPMLVLPCGTLSAIWATRGSSYPILLQAIVAVTLLAISTRSHSQGLSSCSAISTTRVFPWPRQRQSKLRLLSPRSNISVYPASSAWSRELPPIHPRVRRLSFVKPSRAWKLWGPTSPTQSLWETPSGMSVALRRRAFR